MKTLKFLFALTLLSIMLVVFGCDNLNNSGITAIDEDVSAEATAAENVSLLNDEFAKFDALDFEDADAIFSINWRPFYSPVDSQKVTHSHAFAVAPDSNKTVTPHFHSGKDMGTVYLRYDGSIQELNKIEMRNGGIFYSYGEGKHGRHGGPGHREPGFDIVEIPFIAGGIYGFESTGSENFAAATVEATAPQNVIQITSPTHNNMIKANNALIVNWNGGVTDHQLVLALLPAIDPGNRHRPQGGHRGNPGGAPENFGSGPHGGRGPAEGNHGPRPEDSFGGPKLKHHLFKEYALRYLIEENTGEFTIPADELQELLAKVETNKFRLEIMQMTATEIEKDNLKYVVQLRTGDMIMLQIQE